jgi:hypothetical protein
VSLEDKASEIASNIASHPRLALSERDYEWLRGHIGIALCEFARMNKSEFSRRLRAESIEREAEEGGVHVPDEYQPTWRKQA